jgi:hypothetical protein
MATATTEHYRTYTPRPFTRAERDSVTVLVGGLHWRVERVLQAVLEQNGHRSRIPRVLNAWSTHQFWCGLFGALGIDSRNLVFSSDTSEEQGRQFGKGRGTVDCCYPVKCMSGHYGELVFGRKEKLDLAHYLEKYAGDIIAKKKAAMAPGCPLEITSAA